MDKGGDRPETGLEEINDDLAELISSPHRARV